MKKDILKIFQNSQVNTCARVSFLIKLQAEACKNVGQRKSVFWYVSYSVRIRTHYNDQDDARVKTVECNNKHYMNEAVTSLLTQI